MLLALATAAHADCYDDVYYSYECYYSWGDDCDEAFAACDIQLDLPGSDTEKELVRRFEAARAAPGRANARYYYLSRDSRPGDQMALACEEGFHVAHVLELVDGGLVYDLGRGQIASDLSWGPPVYESGWVLSGAGSSSCSDPKVSQSGRFMKYQPEAQRLSFTWLWMLISEIPWTDNGLSPGESWLYEEGDCGVWRAVWCVQD